MSADSNWKPANDMHFTHNGVTIHCENVELRESDETFETTNTESGGAYEYGVNTVRYDVRGTAVIDSDDVRMPTRRTLVAATIDDGIDTVAGKARLTSRTRQGGGKGGYKVPFEGSFTGAVTVS